MRSRKLMVAGIGWLSLLLVGCGAQAPSPPPAPEVTVAPVLQRDIREWDELTGRLEAVDSVEIRPRVSGPINRVTFAEGKEVAQGEVLFEIDPRPYEADLARAEAELARARTGAELAAREVARAKRLVEVQAISREEFDSRTSASAQGEALVRGAEAAVTNARLNLEWCQVRSPIAGRVGKAEVTAGNLVQAGPPAATLLTTVVSLDPIYVSFESDELTYLKYAALSRSRAGGGSRDGRDPILLGLANEAGYPHEGFVDFVDNQLNPKTGTIRVRAVLSNRERLFTPGLFARIKLVGSDVYRATLILDRAIGTDQDKRFVLVLEPDSTVAYRAVELGRVIDGLRIVKAGLQPGERIVIDGMQHVRPGMKVAAKEASMDSGVAAAAATRS
jgi:multidrug efflux system membrane fusion protein